MRTVRLARSMLAQMVLLSVVFLGGGIYLFAVRPVMDYPNMELPDPRQLTLSKAQSIVAAAVASQLPAGQVARLIAGDPFIRDVAAQNPGFRYAAVVGDGRIGEPVHYARLGLDRVAAMKATADPALCVQMERPLTAGGDYGVVSYFNCDRPQYYEITGITKAAHVEQPARLEVYAGLIWRYSRDFLQPALGVFLLCTAIMAANIVTIRRVARLIRPSEEDGHIRPLPERGLPNEVLPLVRAVNRMMTEVSDMEARQRFFLSAAAHEMRTPLTVLRTRLEMLEEGEAKDKLVSDVRRLTRLVNELLTLMSIRAVSEVSGEFDLPACCRRVVTALEPVAGARGVRLDLRVDPDTPSIVGDAALVEVAVTNLVDNAIAFAPPDSTVTIAADAAGVLTVRDRGKGIPAEKAQMLFEPFVRFSKKPGGYGLGLTIVKAVADLHGAALDAFNADDGGATFVLRFPHG